MAGSKSFVEYREGSVSKKIVNSVDAKTTPASRSSRKAMFNVEKREVRIPKHWVAVIYKVDMSLNSGKVD